MINLRQISKSWLHILTLALCLCLAACAVSPLRGQAEPSADNYAQQIRLIAQCREEWIIQEPFETRGYAVTDLDGNGRLELIASQCGGSGLYSTTLFWEVDEAGTALVSCERTVDEGDSEADMMVAEAPAYTDPETGLRFYVFDDLLRNGMTEYYENKRAISLQAGQVAEIPLAYRATVYQDEDHMSVTCRDDQGNLITDEQYEAMPDTRFGHLQKSFARFSWVVNDEAHFEDMTEEEAVALLTASWNGFSAGESLN